MYWVIFDGFPSRTGILISNVKVCEAHYRLILGLFPWEVKRLVVKATKY
jgi:hypothetical protein